jgi:hypothetical protein
MASNGKNVKKNDSESERMNDMIELPVFEKMMLTEFTDMNYLLNVSRSLRDLKHSKFYWKVNRDYSLKYYMDVNYKARLDVLLIDLRTQLS